MAEHDIDPLLVEPQARGGKLLTRHATVLKFFVDERGRRNTTWNTVCKGVACLLREPMQTVKDLVKAGYLKPLKNGWRLTTKGEEEARKIWQN